MMRFSTQSAYHILEAFHKAWFRCCRDAVYCESFLAPVLKELEPFITLQLHFIGQKQVRFRTLLTIFPMAVQHSTMDVLDTARILGR